MTTNDFVNYYWNYYLILENDLLYTKRYLEVDQLNNKAYSTEYLKQYQNICSEIDVVLKQYCKELQNDFNGDKINRYCDCINSKDNRMINEEVSINRNTTLTPWRDWVITSKPEDKQIISNNPNWWTIYNKIKHNRTSVDEESGLQYYKLANQENIYNALAGLFVVEMECYRLITTKNGGDDYYPNIESTIFEMKNWERRFKRPLKLQYEVKETL